MNKIKRLPDAEFEIMKVVWRNPSPITTNQIIADLPEDKVWKAPTVLTMLLRLVDKDFLSSEKNGKERIYTPIVSEAEYLQLETGNFFKKFYDNSLTNLVASLYEDKKLSKADIEELKKLLDDMG